MSVPCSRCAACLSRKREEWSFRLKQQLKVSTSCIFITLTYKEENLPINENGVASVNKRDVQLFFKRLRKNSNQKELKYYLSSEYGTKTFRPHYHIVLFDLINTDLILTSWGLGNIKVDKINDARISYTTKYCITKSKIPKGATTPFSLQSKNLGLNYVEKKKHWHEQDIKRMYCTNDNGTKIAMPRYYKEKIYTEFDRENFSYYMNNRVNKITARKKCEHEKTQKKSYYEYTTEQKLEYIKKIDRIINKSNKI